MNRDERNDLGLSGRIAQSGEARVLNRDGTFNVLRHGRRRFDSAHVYHLLLTISWARFYVLTVAVYMLTNALFAAAYLMCGEGALAGGEASTAWGRFADAYFFSVQTLATIGYGKMTPNGFAANVLVTVEALFGLFGFALATGLMFARFSRPSAGVVFSEVAVVAPYREGRALMLRVANGRRAELTRIEARLTYSRMETRDGRRSRRYYQLDLERNEVGFLPLQWVIVHPINDASPMAAETAETAVRDAVEVFVLLSAVDETFSQTVFRRTSYHASEIRWDERFSDIHKAGPGGQVALDVGRLGETERAAR